jgi:sugar lactone lactonase YvrE
MKNLFFLILVVMVVFACQSPKQESTESTADTVAVAKPPVTLQMAWQTDTVLTTCESVLYDKDHDVLYVSDINGAPDAKDKNGFISKVGLDGKVIEAQWVKGMDAPKGLGLANGKLYVADIDRVHEVDVNTGKITKTNKVNGAKFLNDVTTDANGKVYISDTGAGTIQVIENGKLSQLADSLKGPNGLLADNNQFFVAQWDAKTLGTLDLTTKQVTVKADSIDNPDGIEAVGDGSYLVSSWNGMITYVSPEWKKTVVLDTRADSVSAADIEYIPEKNLLLIPTFFKNKVVAYTLSKQ